MLESLVGQKYGDFFANAVWMAELWQSGKAVAGMRFTLCIPQLVGEGACESRTTSSALAILFFTIKVYRLQVALPTTQTLLWLDVRPRHVWLDLSSPQASDIWELIEVARFTDRIRELDGQNDNVGWWQNGRCAEFKPGNLRLRANYWQVHCSSWRDYRQATWRAISWTSSSSE